MATDFRKGQTVYIVPKYERDGKPFYAKIVSIGSKYITIDNMHYSECRFNISDLYEATTGRYKLYASEDSYKLELKIQSKRRNIRNFIDRKLPLLNGEQIIKLELLLKSFDYEILYKRD